MFDLAIIGLGPAGLEALDSALKQGLNVVAFEKNELGGTCLNVGCVPTKSIIHCAKSYCEIKKAQNLGITVSEPTFDWQKIIERKSNIVSKFTKALNIGYSKKATIVKAEAELVLDGSEVKIRSNNELYEAKNIIVSTGSKPVELKGLEFDHKFIINSDDLLGLQELPKSITIVGSGAIGAEWAQILAMLDVEVKVVEKAPSLAPAFDIDIQKRIERIFKLNKIEFYKNDYIASIDNHKITMNSGKTFETDMILSAVGRKPILPDIIDLKTNSKVPFNEVKVNNLFAIGDSIGGVMLAHKASFEAHQLMEKILFNRELAQAEIPKVMYLTPEIASIGVNEQDIDPSACKIKKVLLSTIAKSWCDEATDGFLKVIIKENRIIGCHIVSNEASSLIMIVNALMDKTVDEIKDMIFPHPSYSELILEALKND